MAEPISISAPRQPAVVRLKSRASGAAAAGGALLDQQPLPMEIGGSTLGRWRALCLGPGEWWITTDGELPAHAREDIRRQAHEQNISAIDLSAGLAVLRISGPAVRELLATGCGIDFQRGLAAGNCARTRFAQIPVTLECRAPESFELYVGRSYAVYLHSWLLDAATEWLCA